MTVYALLILTPLILAPLPWIAIYRLDRRCAEGVGTGQQRRTGKVSPTLTAAPTPSADRRLAESPERHQPVRRAQPGGPM